MRGPESLELALEMTKKERKKIDGQVDLAETDENENENERGNENEKGNGRQESYGCGIGRRSCKPTLSCKIVWCIQRLITGSRQAAHLSYIILNILG